MFCLLLDLKIKFFAVRIYKFLILFKNCNFNNFNFCHFSFFKKLKKHRSHKTSFRSTFLRSRSRLDAKKKPLAHEELGAIVRVHLPFPIT
ncbi:hypothetical protein CKA32_000303 [Geitlerinema sp. FC II]|nr:hypothetical protein CKA32_000303 [Geitlerinema sp. FC II]